MPNENVKAFLDILVWEANKEYEKRGHSLLSILLNSRWTLSTTILSPNTVSFFSVDLDRSTANLYIQIINSLVLTARVSGILKVYLSDTGQMGKQRVNIEVKKRVQDHFTLTVLNRDFQRFTADRRFGINVEDTYQEIRMNVSNSPPFAYVYWYKTSDPARSIKFDRPGYDSLSMDWEIERLQSTLPAAGASAAVNQSLVVASVPAPIPAVLNAGAQPSNEQLEANNRALMAENQTLREALTLTRALLPHGFDDPYADPPAYQPSSPAP